MLSPLYRRGSCISSVLAGPATSAHVWRHFASHGPAFCFKIEFSLQSTNSEKPFSLKETFSLDYGNIGNRWLFAPNFGHRPASDEATRPLIDTIVVKDVTHRMERGVF